MKNLFGFQASILLGRLILKCTYCMLQYGYCHVCVGIIGMVAEYWTETGRGLCHEIHGETIEQCCQVEFESVKEKMLTEINNHESLNKNIYQCSL